MASPPPPYVVIVIGARRSGRTTVSHFLRDHAGFLVFDCRGRTLRDAARGLRQMCAFSHGASVVVDNCGITGPMRNVLRAAVSPDDRRVVTMHAMKRDDEERADGVVDVVLRNTGGGTPFTELYADIREALQLPAAEFDRMGRRVHRTTTDGVRTLTTASATRVV
jgi:NAD(P)-dependent dehydrogenase (short-subunit alcohol dehydrogenase family)